MNTNTKEHKIGNIAPFKTQQLVAGLRLDNMDDTLLNYLNFFITRIMPTEVTFSHIVPKFSSVSIMVDEAFTSTLDSEIDEEEIISKMKIKVKDYLKNENEINFLYEVQEGDVLEKFMDVVDRNLADLIIVGRSKEKKHNQILVKNLIRETKSNILIVPENAKPIIKRIIVPTDFSVNALRALKTAIAINKKLENPVPIVCIHVYALYNYSHFRIDRPWNIFRQDIQRNIKGIFEDIKSSFSEEDAETFSLAMIEGKNPNKANYITEYTNQEAGNLIVMGSKGHSKIQQLLLGSVTERVIKNNNTVPMFIVK